MDTITVQEADSLGELEARILKAVETVSLLKREKESLEKQAAGAIAGRQQAEREAADARAEAQQARKELEDLRGEQKKVRSRIEKLLTQIDALTAS